MNLNRIEDIGFAIIYDKLKHIQYGYKRLVINYYTQYTTSYLAWSDLFNFSFVVSSRLTTIIATFIIDDVNMNATSSALNGLTSARLRQRLLIITRC